MKTAQIEIKTNITITTCYDIEIEDNENIDTIKEREKKEFENNLPNFYGMYDVSVDTDIGVTLD